MLELLTVLVITHITILSVTLYLHRSQAHRAVTFHPAISHFMRFWVWMTTGMVTREWVAVHRLHHQKCETDQDPHSPQTHGIWSVLFGGAWLYTEATRDRAMVARLSGGTPDDWIERTVYSRYPNLGYLALLIALVTVFHGWGIVMWLAIVAWIPFWAAGVINGVGHWWGYRNTNTPDESHNIVPWGIIVGGEELHNNHHSRPASARLSQRWWEFDLGWAWICVLRRLGLCTLHRA